MRASTRLAATLVAALVCLPACRPDGIDAKGLTRTRVPSSGVSMQWKLQPGTALTGHLRIGHTRNVEGLDKPLSQAVECDVNLIVTATPPADGVTRLSATVANMDLAWGLPPATDYAPDEFRELALKRMRDYRGWIDVDARGRVVGRSPAPVDYPPELVELVRALLDAVEVSFVIVPPGPVARGEAWDAKTEREGMVGTASLTLEGLYLDRKGGDSLAAVRSAHEGSRDVRGRDGVMRRQESGEIVALFSIDGGFVAKVDGEESAFSPEDGMAFRRVRAAWEVSRGIVPPTVGEQTTQDVQVITDPCNPDYVGPEVCKTAPEPAPEPKAEPKAEPEPDPKPKAVPEPKAEPEPAPVPETESKTKTEAEPDPKAEPESESKSKSKAKPESEPEAKSKAKSKPEAEAEAEPKPKPKPKPEPKPKPS